jgi:hypothetical protein
MRAILFAILLAAGLSAAAQEPRKYAVLSLVGDALMVIEREMTTGSRVDRNVRTRLAVDTPALDNAIVRALDREIERMIPGANPVLLAARRAEFFEIQSRALDEGAGIQKVIEALKPVVAPTNATHLILATKHRALARLRIASGNVGDGLLEGLGFYLDHHMKLVNRETGATGDGFIAPYAYFIVSLVDLRTGEVVKRSTVTESHAQGNTAAQTTWGTLTPEDKQRMLEGLIRRGVQGAVPELLRN